MPQVRAMAVSFSERSRRTGVSRSASRAASYERSVSNLPEPCAFASSVTSRTRRFVRWLPPGRAGPATTDPAAAWADRAGGGARVPVDRPEHGAPGAPGAHRLVERPRLLPAHLAEDDRALPEAEGDAEGLVGGHLGPAEGGLHEERLPLVPEELEVADGELGRVLDRP